MSFHTEKGSRRPRCEMKTRPNIDNYNAVDTVNLAELGGKLYCGSVGEAGMGAPGQARWGQRGGREGKEETSVARLASQ